jgi:hypothetical protein
LLNPKSVIAAFLRDAYRELAWRIRADGGKSLAFAIDGGQRACEGGIVGHGFARRAERRR